MIIVDISMAVICFFHAGQQVCHHALVGPSTPRGTFSLVQRLTSDAGYGGDVLQFHEDANAVFAIHRVWTLKPEQRRLERLKSGDARQRQQVTSGCINVSEETYRLLVECCLDHRLTIK